MANESLGVLHIETIKEWRGGQQQIAYLFDSMLDNGYRTSLVCQPGSKLEWYAKKRHQPFFSIAMSGEFDLRAAYKIAAYAKNNHFNILHAHSAHALAIGILAKYFYRELILIGSRRVIPSVRKPLIGPFKYKHPFINKIICISEFVRQILINDGLDPEKLTTIYSGINTRKFDHVKPARHFKAELGIPENQLLVGTIAALSGDKDYTNLLEAAGTVLSRHKQVTFCAVGDGPDRTKILRLHKTLGLGRRFIFTGFREDVGALLKIFDIFVLASKKEGMGTSILDAQSVGLPIVATRAGGIPEIVRHGKSGLLVEPQNPAALAEAIGLLISDEQRRNQYGKTARECVKQFDVSNTVSKTVALYRQLISKGQ